MLGTLWCSIECFQVVTWWAFEIPCRFRCLLYFWSGCEVRHRAKIGDISRGLARCEHCIWQLSISIYGNALIYVVEIELLNVRVWLADRATSTDYPHQLHLLMLQLNNLLNSWVILVSLAPWRIQLLLQTDIHLGHRIKSLLDLLILLYHLALTFVMLSVAHPEFTFQISDLLLQILNQLLRAGLLADLLL